MSGKLKRYNKEILNYYIGREAELQSLENYQRELADRYDNAFEAIIDLIEKVTPQKDSEGGKFWINNLVKIKELFPIIDSVTAENNRLRGTVNNLHDSYRSILDKYHDLEKKYEDLIENKI